MVRLKLRGKSDIAVPSVRRERRRCRPSVGRHPVGSLRPLVVRILVRYAPFLGRCFFAFFFLWPDSLPQKTFEELAVLVEVFDVVVMVGARALHELVEVAQRVLPGLRACLISRVDQRRVGRSAVTLSVLFPPLRGGALILIPVLGLALAPASVGAW